MSAFSREPFPHDLCLPGNHLVDIQVDGASVESGFGVYITRVTRALVPSLPVVPPALRGTGGGHQPPGPGTALRGRSVWVVIALDPGQEEELSRGSGGILNRAVVHLLYEDGTVISDFEDYEDAVLVSTALCSADPGHYPGPEQGP